MTTAQQLSIGDAAGVFSRRPHHDRAFAIALTVAALLHGSFFLSLLAAPTRIIGNPDGRPDAINVTTITESEFRDQFAQERAGQGPAPTPPVPAAEPAPSQPPQEEAPAEPDIPPLDEAPPVEPEKSEQEEPTTEPEKQSADAETEKPSEADTQVAEEAKDEQQQEKAEKAEERQVPDALQSENTPTIEEIEKAAPGLLSVPDPAAEQRKAQANSSSSNAKPKSSKRQRQAALDLSAPAARFDALPGGGAGTAAFQRPPGITRSGLNEDFARRVIMALQATMPQLTNTRGRVTVRIFLTTNGNIESVRVIKQSNVSGLDQSVVFATKQTNYPIPPVGSNTADRTFLVTYIYE